MLLWEPIQFNLIFLNHTGVVDAQVLPEHTSVFEISPRPRNISAAAPTKVYTLNKYYQIKAWMGSSLSSCYHTVKAIFISPPADNATVLEEQEPSRNVTGKFGYITKTSWDKDILSYMEPIHISLRSVQLEDVGFLVDHYAMTWCYDLLASVHSGLRVLVRKPDASMGMILEGFGVKNLTGLYQDVETAGAVGIPQLEEFALREAVHEQFQATAIEEPAILLKKLAGNYIWLLAVQYYSRHLSMIVVSFIGLAIFSWAGEFMGKLCGYRPANKMSFPNSGIVINFKLLRHASECLFRQIGVSIMPEMVGIAMLWVLVAMALYNVTAPIPSPSTLALFWVMSMVLGHCLLYIAFNVLRFVVFLASYVFHAGYVLCDFFRLTRLVDFTKQYVRATKRRGPWVLQVTLPFIVEYSFELALLSAVLSAFVLTWPVHHHLGFAVYMFSVLSWVLFGAVVLIFVAFLVHNYDNLLNGENAAMLTLGVAILLFAWPSFDFAWKLIDASNSHLHLLSEPFSLFTGERLEYCLILAVIFFHLSRKCSSR